MSDEPDFSELGGEETQSSSSSSSSSSRTQFKQVHISGRYGTKTIKNTEGCHVCGRKSEVVLLLGFSKMLQSQAWDRGVQVCENHVGDVRGDVEYQRDEIKEVRF